MFDIHAYPFDTEHNYMEIGGEAMIFHCHHYLTILTRTILDADYIDSRPMMIGSSADANYNQLKNLCANHSIAEAKLIAQEVYKTFGYGLLDLSSMDENGFTLSTTKSFFSKTWKMKFGLRDQPIDYYTSGFLAAAYAVIYGRELAEVQVEQTECIACGAPANIHVVKLGTSNFTIYPPKQPVAFKNVPKLPLNWEHEAVLTNTFLGAHATLIGNEEGYIPAFGVYVVRNQSDYVNRLQFEFGRAMIEVAGDYGITLAGELLMEAGHACGFFTYGGIMTSNEWNTYVKPYLKTREDWVKGLAAIINTMGWGYHTAAELSEERAVFRNYNDFEDLSYLRMYGESSYPIHWANSGGFTGLMQLVYKTDLIIDGSLGTEEGFRQMRRSKLGYKTHMSKSIACGDDYLEVIISQ